MIDAQKGGVSQFSQNNSLLFPFPCLTALQVVAMSPTFRKSSAPCPSAIDGLRQIYHTKIQPLEELYHFDQFHSPCLTDLDALPMVLLLGQYSTGKTTFVEYLLGRPYPGTPSMLHFRLRSTHWTRADHGQVGRSDEIQSRGSGHPRKRSCRASRQAVQRTLPLWIEFPF